MLDAACQQALALDHDGLTQPIDAPDPGVPGPPDRIPQPREGEASLILFLLTPSTASITGFTRCPTRPSTL